jgi:hypothetical protein
MMNRDRKCPYMESSQREPWRVLLLVIGRVERRLTVANIVAKTLVCGALAATLAAAAPSSAVADYAEFSGPPVNVDPYNEMLAATMPPSMTVDVRFSGRLVRLDPYNATLAAAVLSSVRTVAVDDLYNSYAFAPGYDGPRLWENSIPFAK